jgi:hypothetical protein
MICILLMICNIFTNSKRCCVLNGQVCIESTVSIHGQGSGTKRYSALEIFCCLCNKCVGVHVCHIRIDCGIDGPKVCDERFKNLNQAKP